MPPNGSCLKFYPRVVYPACVAMAGAVPRYCTLRFPEFRVDLAELEALFSPRTRALLVNTPHNPTGKVFTREELQAIASSCKRHDVVAAIPPSVFYASRPEAGRSLVRFAFCKRMETLRAAAERLRVLRPAG